MREDNENISTETSLQFLECLFWNHFEFLVVNSYFWLCSGIEYDVGSIDYESFDEKKIAQLGELHAAADSDDDTGKKKKKKKNKKKKKKKKWVNPKDAFQNMKVDFFRTPLTSFF